MRRFALAGLLLVACAHRGEPELFRQAAQGLERAQARRGDLALACEPPDAEVWVDDVPLGTCGDFAGERGVPVGGGMRRLRVKKPGYQTYETWLDTDGTKARLAVKLVPSLQERGVTP